MKLTSYTSYFKLEKETLSFTFPLQIPDGRGNYEIIGIKEINFFNENYDKFYLTNQIGHIKPIILEVSLCWSNGRINAFNYLVPMAFDTKQIKPEVKIITKEESIDKKAIIYSIEFSGEFYCKFTPNERFINDHKNWGNSKIDLFLNFRHNFKNPNSLMFGNIYSLIEDIKDKFHFTSNLV